MPDRLPSLVLLVGFWVPPAVVGWTAAKAAHRRTYAVLGTFVLAWAAAWFFFQINRMPPYIPGATHDPTYAPPGAVKALGMVAGTLVLPVSALACALAFRLRRRALGLLVLAAALCTAPLAAQQARAPRHTYVIVHGAWGGGWDWQAVDSMLTRRGARVRRVTLTGLGERVHLASPDVGLHTHIDDVVNTILWENLQDVVLVGHSYGGMVITGVADRIPGRIRRLVYVDAFLPDSGEAAIGLVDTVRGALVRTRMEGGFSIPTWVPDTTVIPRDVPQPLKTFTDTLRLVNPAARRVPATYILTVEPNVVPDPFQRFADRAAQRGWPVYRLDANHTPERSARQPLVDLLLAVP